MPERIEFPDYPERAMAQYLKRNPSRNKNRFAKERGIEPWQIPRWLEAPPASMADLIRWSRALEVPWAWLLIGDEGFDDIRRWKENPRKWARG